MTTLGKRSVDIIIGRLPVPSPLERGWGEVS
jgi:hypothetical protein